MKRYVRSDAGNRPEKNRRGVPGESEAARCVHRPGNERFRSIATPRLTQIPALLHSLLWIVDSRTGRNGFRDHDLGRRRVKRPM